MLPGMYLGQAVVYARWWVRGRVWRMTVVRGASTDVGVRASAERRGGRLVSARRVRVPAGAQPHVLGAHPARPRHRGDARRSRDDRPGADWGEAQASRSPRSAPRTTPPRPRVWPARPSTHTPLSLPSPSRLPVLAGAPLGQLATSNPLVCALCGGINCKSSTAFPTLSHVHYSAIQPVVRKTCAEFGIPYVDHPTVGAAYRSALRRSPPRRPRSALARPSTEKRTLASPPRCRRGVLFAFPSGDSNTRH